MNTILLSIIINLWLRLRTNVFKFSDPATSFSALAINVSMLLVDCNDTG